ncbi:hypothetical protein AVEN_145019-1 [Araneus ventricosus]|uniref:Uncharacterized protein n=1 Tax=Araneus ventricosus TaxID=182803 RepID=A0A4Y2J5G3_ARAVE|nr:hypothetical protein AVEN_145019-1 [Araneus ventricosus]
MTSNVRVPFNRYKQQYSMPYRKGRNFLTAHMATALAKPFVSLLELHQVLIPHTMFNLKTSVLCASSSAVPGRLGTMDGLGGEWRLNISPTKALVYKKQPYYAKELRPIRSTIAR